jgi:hypothetical protein
MKGLNKKLKGFKTGPTARVYQYLRDHHKDEADSPIGILVSYIKRIEGFKIGSYEANVKTRQLTALYKLEELPDGLCGFLLMSLIVDGIPPKMRSRL